MATDAGATSSSPDAAESGAGDPASDEPDPGLRRAWQLCDELERPLTAVTTDWAAVERIGEELRTIA